MGWAAHGDVCLGFEGEPNDKLRRRLEGTVRARVRDFPEAVHYVLFGEGGDVAAHRVEA